MLIGRPFSLNAHEEASSYALRDYGLRPGMYRVEATGFDWVIVRRQDGAAFAMVGRDALRDVAWYCDPNRTGIAFVG